MDDIALRTALAAALELGPGWGERLAPWDAPIGGGGTGMFRAASPLTSPSANEVSYRPFLILPNPDPVKGAFDAIVSSNISCSKGITIPPHYPVKAAEYGNFAPADGVIIRAALARSPKFYRGGWILSLQPGAAAMTLDTSIFVAEDLSIGTWIHELVHVHQYAKGVTSFLVGYFGMSIWTILKRIVNREPLQIMRSSPHEDAAYELGKRFMDWYSKNP